MLPFEINSEIVERERERFCVFLCHNLLLLLLFGTQLREFLRICNLSLSLTLVFPFPFLPTILVVSFGSGSFVRLISQIRSGYLFIATSSISFLSFFMHYYYSLSLRGRCFFLISSLDLGFYLAPLYLFGWIMFWIFWLFSVIPMTVFHSMCFNFFQVW